jgi:hypothetical protein
MRSDQIRIRDPFVLPVPDEGRYYLYGTTDENLWRGPGTGFDCYVGTGLEDWEGPFPAFRPEAGFWGSDNFWAPEVHRYRGRYLMLASFIAPGRTRATHILAAPSPRGPFRPLGPEPATPAGWQCLDGSLFVDAGGRPWIVFCREWVQVNDGEVWALPLAEDLAGASGEPRLLFRASEAAWTKCLPRRDGSGLVDARVTDGPFLHRRADGGLLLLWSSLSPRGYALGVARSASGGLEGPWLQEAEPLIDTDGGHGMVFRGFDGRLYLTYHTPNATPNERFHYAEVVEAGAALRLKG